MENKDNKFFSFHNEKNLNILSRRFGLYYVPYNYVVIKENIFTGKPIVLKHGVHFIIGDSKAYDMKTKRLDFDKQIIDGYGNQDITVDFAIDYSIAGGKDEEDPNIGKYFEITEPSVQSRRINSQNYAARRTWAREHKILDYYNNETELNKEFNKELPAGTTGMLETIVQDAVRRNLTNLKFDLLKQADSIPEDRKTLDKYSEAGLKQSQGILEKAIKELNDKLENTKDEQAISDIKKQIRDKEDELEIIEQNITWYHYLLLQDEVKKEFAKKGLLVHELKIKSIRQDVKTNALDEQLKMAKKQQEIARIDAATYATKKEIESEANAKAIFTEGKAQADVEKAKAEAKVAAFSELTPEAIAAANGNQMTYHNVNLAGVAATLKEITKDVKANVEEKQNEVTPVEVKEEIIETPVVEENSVVEETPVAEEAPVVENITEELPAIEEAAPIEENEVIGAADVTEVLPEVVEEVNEAPVAEETEVPAVETLFADAYSLANDSSIEAPAKEDFTQSFDNDFQVANPVVEDDITPIAVYDEVEEENTNADKIAELNAMKSELEEATKDNDYEQVTDEEFTNSVNTSSNSDFAAQIESAFNEEKTFDIPEVNGVQETDHHTYASQFADEERQKKVKLYTLK